MWTATKWKFQDLSQGDQVGALAVLQTYSDAPGMRYVAVPGFMVSMRLAEYLRQEGFDHTPWQNVPASELKSDGAHGIHVIPGRQLYEYFKVDTDVAGHQA